MRKRLALGLLLALGCSRGGVGPGADDLAIPAADGDGPDGDDRGDLGDSGDLGADLRAAADLRGADLAAADLRAADLAPPPDLAFSGRATVEIDATDTCVVTTTPRELSVPHGQQVRIDWHNRSPKVPVDVWLSYGGGYTDLGPGRTWNEPVNHCIGPLAHDEYAEISACGAVRYKFLIHCL